MAENKSGDITDLSPDSLLNTFTKKSLTQFMLIAIVIHVIVIGVTSLGTFKTWAMGPADETVETSSDNADDPSATSTDGAETTSAQSPANGSGTTSNANAGKAKGKGGEGDQPEEGNAYVEELRKVASPDEIPSDSDIGISLEDTSFD